MENWCPKCWLIMDQQSRDAIKDVVSIRKEH